MEQLSQKTLQPGTLVFPVGQRSQKTLVFPVGQLSQKTLQQVLGVPVEAPPVVPPPCQCGFLKGVRILNQNPESVSGDNSPDLDLDHVFERAIEYDSAEGKMRTDEALALFDDFAKLELDQRVNWIQSSSRCSQEDVNFLVVFGFCKRLSRTIRQLLQLKK